MRNLFEVQPVTALFDIDRARTDGRSVQDYLQWLEGTIKLFPNLIVFHNLSLHSKFINRFPFATFIEMEFSALPLHNQKEALNSICHNYLELGSNDLVYKSVAYGILVNSKLYFLAIASKQVKAKYYQWVDVGTSRFVSQRIQFSYPETAQKSYFVLDISSLLRQVLVKRSLNYQKLVPIGTSVRVLSGLGFAIPASILEETLDQYGNFLLQVIHRGSWDTEQVLLFNLLPKIRPKLNFESRNSYQLPFLYKSRIQYCLEILLEKILYATIFR